MQSHSQALLLEPALAAWGGLSPPGSSPLVPEHSPWLLHHPRSAAGTSERAGPTHEREMSSPTLCQEYLPTGCVRPWAWQVLHRLLLRDGSSNVQPTQPVAPSSPSVSPWQFCLGLGCPAPSSLQRDLAGFWLLQDIKLLPPSPGSEGVWEGGGGTARHIQGSATPVNQ